MEKIQFQRFANSARLPGAKSPVTLGFGFLPQDIDAAVAVGEEEHVVVVVPGDLVHLELELLLCPGAMGLGVDKGHHIIFVPNSDGLTIRAPADVDVLS